MNRLELADKIFPFCESDTCCLTNGNAFGWLYSSEQIEKALNLWRNVTLTKVSFLTKNKNNKSFTIEHPSRLGIVPHREGKVYFFAVDLDAHEGQKDMTEYDEKLAKFFGGNPVRFHSKSGKGIRQIYFLKSPIDIKAFLHFIKSWGFNRTGRIEIFPKTDKLTQFWLPNEPNAETGGDSYISGTWENAIILLPETIPVNITNAGLDLLLGFVPAGNRNAALYSCACELGNKNADRQIAYRLCNRAAILCGLESREIDATFKSGYDDGLSKKGHGNQEEEYLISNGTSDILITEAWFAKCIAKKHIDKIRFNCTSGKFLIYDGKQWKEDNHGLVYKLSEELLKRFFKDASSSEGDRGKLLKALLKFEKHQIFRGALDFFKELSEIRKTEQDFDRDYYLFNCQNGTLNLKTLDFKPHNPLDHLSKISGALYEPAAQFPKWKDFLCQIFNGDDSLILYVQKAVGVSLAGECLEQCLFFCYGNGANGKSVFFETIKRLLGNYYQKTSAEMLMARDQRTQIPNDIAHLRGARFVVASELQDGQRFNEAVLKDLTGGDTIRARFLYKEPFEFTPSHTLWIYGNHQPVIRGLDEGIWRRIKLIPFTVQIPLEARVPLPELVDSFSKELSGILNWAIDGWEIYRQEGLIDCAAVKEATTGYRQDSDSLQAFLDEKTDCVKSLDVNQSALYSSYQDWCKKAGEYQQNRRRFCLMMREHGFKARRGSQGCKIWDGLSLKSDF
ncbi:MAG: phage/plasmid primase, P4 family [Chitinivibrionales bacterium]|nr:phage/plasmid primase, P4 family [Chitinivibrionales bacterium]